jgi:hypothetical protein
MHPLHFAMPVQQGGYGQRLLCDELLRESPSDRNAKRLTQPSAAVSYTRWGSIWRKGLAHPFTQMCALIAPCGFPEGATAKKPGTAAYIDGAPH